MHYEKTRDVAAPPEALWRAITSIERWPQWTMSIKEAVLVDRELGPAARVRILQPKLRAMTYRVDEWEPGSHFSWIATSPGIEVRAGHEVHPAGGGSRLRLTIDMSGPMAWLLVRIVGERARGYVDTEADGMRRFAEHLASAPDAA